MLNVKIKRLSETAILPTYGTAKAAAMDLYADCAEPVEVPAHGTVKIHTGFAFQPPAGYCALLLARSGLATKQGLAPANKVGLCDEDYRGEYVVALHNHSDEPVFVSHGDRIAQLMFLPYEQAVLTEVSELDETDRGAGGFGSTGR